MKTLLYTAIVIILITSCTSSRNFAMEDDIYYFPGKKSLTITEVEKVTGQEINSLTQNDSYSEEISRSKGSHIAPADFQKSNQQLINTHSNELETVDLNALALQAKTQLANNENVNETIYQNTGYWIGGYKGNEGDLYEIQQIINQYPNGFAFFSANASDIAMNLSFDSDWNVYTDDGHYWWFPSHSNIELYSSLLFGTYPKHIWTIAWDNPRFDSWAFDSHFNNNVNWNINIGWGNPGWSFGFGWNSGYYSGYNHGWYDPWCDPWHRPYYGYNSCWNRPYWNRPHWDDNYYPIYPSRPIPIKPGGSRPGVGNIISGVRPGNSNRPGSVTRPNTTTRPSNMTRPGTSTTRPGASVRPNTRPSSVTRPTTRPSSVTRPSSSTRPSSVTRPSTRPSNVTRPSTRPSRVTRPSTKPSVNRSNNSYSHPQNNYVPTRSSSSSSYNRGSSSSSSRSSSVGTRSSGSSGRSSGTPTRNSSGGNRRR